MDDLGNSKKGINDAGLPYDKIQREQADSRALKEIIDILKEPFQTSCHTCYGMGYNKNGHDCPTCEGSGKVMDGNFK